MKKVVEWVSQARALVFDFDGTLVDSNPIKWKAFETCFSAFPGQLKEILAYCRANNHTSRWEKFRHVYEKILHLPYSPDVEQRLSRRFEEETTGRIVETPEVPSAEKFLRRIQETYWTGLLSATPQPILEEILKKRGWTSLFRQVRGTPVRKASWLQELRAREGWGPRDLVFFGDMPEDAEAAARAACLFVQVGESRPAGPEDCVISDYEKLTATLKETRQC